MKKIVLILSLLITMVTNSLSKDFETSQVFKAGDVISADVMNDTFATFADNFKQITELDLVGTWNLKQVVCKNSPNCGSSLPNGFVGFVTDLNDITAHRNDTITFVNNENGTYSYQQSTYSSIGNRTIDTPSSGKYAILNGSMLVAVDSNDNSNIGLHYIKRISSTRIILYILNLSSSSYNVVELDKVNIPPIKPTLLKTELNSNIVTLTWQDNSNDETGFDIFRKDSQDGTYSLVKNVSSNSYSETLTNGTYWYRVQSKNTYGNSEGSNVVKVVISN